MDTELDADTWYYRGCYEESVSLEDAAEAYKTALTMDPDHAAAHINLGRLLHHAGHVEAAEDRYRRAIRIEPQEAIAWYNLGVALEDQQRRSEAVHAYRTALALQPGCIDAHFNLAGLLEQLDDRVGALRHWAMYRRLAESEETQHAGMESRAYVANDDACSNPGGEP